MEHARGCVWIDHRQARIFGISADSVDELVVHDAHAPAHIHRRADNVHLGKARPDKAFLDKVAGFLTGFRGFVIVGPERREPSLPGTSATTIRRLPKGSGGSNRWIIHPMRRSQLWHASTFRQPPACEDRASPFDCGQGAADPFDLADEHYSRGGSPWLIFTERLRS